MRASGRKNSRPFRRLRGSQIAEHPAEGIKPCRKRSLPALPGATAAIVAVPAEALALVRAYGVLFLVLSDFLTQLQEIRWRAAKVHRSCEIFVRESGGRVQQQTVADLPHAVVLKAAGNVHKAGLRDIQHIPADGEMAGALAAHEKVVEVSHDLLNHCQLLPSSFLMTSSSTTLDHVTRKAERPLWR